MPQGVIPALVTSTVQAGHEMEIDDLESESPTEFTCTKCGAGAHFSPDNGNTWDLAVHSVCTS